ncbi:MAG: RNA polymerase sigma factor [Firmicutes bacterium]|nr:RNA polymerase sigma factor [Bacillota bacterium]
MYERTEKEMSVLIDKAVSGDKDSVETIILDIQDFVFNFSLRMLGTFNDAEDAAQDIIVKIITNLSSFRKESAFSTWVFSITANHLKNYKKYMFAQHPLSFEFYGNDIENAPINDVPDITQNIERSVLEEELKLSCTNVMLQCLDMESRCIFVMGTMFKADSKMAGEILGITPETYRKRLSRIRAKMADFLEEYCGAYGSGNCRCKNRINYAVHTHRLNPAQLDYTSASEISQQKMIDVKNAMEDIDDLSARFAFCKSYESTERTKKLLHDMLNSESFAIVKNS